MVSTHPQNLKAQANDNTLYQNQPLKNLKKKSLQKTTFPLKIKINQPQPQPLQPQSPLPPFIKNSVTFY